jgi:branched-chain amino acid transport system substrate-binding protein
MNRVSSSVWLSESDMDVVGRDQCKGVIKLEPCASGQSPKVIQDILKTVIEPGKGAGDKAKVGTGYYNYGVMMAALMVEGVRQAFAKAPNGPISGEWLNKGLTSIKDFTAEGLIPATTVTEKDHQGSGMCRVARWDGTKFAPATDWFSANQDIVWQEIRKSSAEFKASGK